MDDPTAYPLAWPPTVPRHTGDRLRAKFGTTERKYSTQPGSTHTYVDRKRMTMATALERLRYELRRLGVDSFIVSSNVPVRKDGMRYSQIEPKDPGVAVYFTMTKKPYCLPCDRWDRVADNAAAIAAHLDAMRGMDRWGVGSIEQAFTGYLALPSPDQVDWRAEFPHVQTYREVELLYRERAKALHPDLENGHHDAMVRLNRAREAARRELVA